MVCNYRFDSDAKDLDEEGEDTKPEKKLPITKRKRKASPIVSKSSKKAKVSMLLDVVKFTHTYLQTAIYTQMPLKDVP